ncbi:MAG: SpoIIE family protein phosphatase, partial [Treponema sp.]|nr:SpoIIE family protein phosphatase [Treponema sp.]
VLKIKNLLALVFTLLLLSEPVFAKRNKPPRIELDSGWSYTLFENAKAYLPLNNKYFSNLPAYVPDHRGYIWIKNTFYIPPELEYKNIAVYLGQIKVASEVYVNGVHIGASGYMPPKEFFNGEKSTAFQIPQSIIKYDNQPNTIVVKLWVNTTGKLGDSPFISTPDYVFLTRSMHDLLASEFPFAISIFLFFISFLYIFFYFIRPSDKSNLSFGLLTLFSSLYLFPICYGEYPFGNTLDYLLFNKFFNAFVPYTAMHLAVSFIRDFLGKKETRWFKIFRIIFSAVIFTIPFFALTLWQFFILQVIGYIVSGFLFLYPIKIILEDIFNRRKKVNSLLIGFSPVLLSLLLAIILITFTDFQYIKLLVCFGWQFTILIFLGLLLVNYVKLFSRVEYVNTNLEKIVKHKTQELQNANKALEEINNNLEQEQKRTEREMELASFVQQSFYSLRKTDFSDWEIAVYFKPLQGVSGDLYDLYIREDTIKGLSIFDVSGHGISSGLVTMLVKNIIQQEFYEGINEDLSQVLHKINERIIKEKGSIENYLTGIMFRINKNVLEFVNAGHPEPILICKNDASKLLKKEAETQCGVIGIGGIPTVFTTTSIKLQKNDVLMLYTDGITEAVNSNNEMFGKNRLLELLDENKNLSIQELSEKIKTSIYNFIGDAEIKDDITFLLLKRK